MMDASSGAEFALMDARFCCGVNEIKQTIRGSSLEGSFKNARRHCVRVQGR
jgi:hypothetical protein